MIGSARVQECSFVEDQGVSCSTGVQAGPRPALEWRHDLRSVSKERADGVVEKTGCGCCVRCVCSVCARKAERRVGIGPFTGQPCGRCVNFPPGHFLIRPGPPFYWTVQASGPPSGLIHYGAASKLSWAIARCIAANARYARANRTRAPRLAAFAKSHERKLDSSVCSGKRAAIAGVSGCDRTCVSLLAYIALD